MFSKLVKYCKDYLTFNKSERRGLLVLCSLILLLIILNILLPFLKTQKTYDYSKFDAEVNEFMKTQEVLSVKPKTYRQKEPFNIYDANASAVEQKLNPVAFDPNTLPYDGFIEMGLSPKQALTIIKYRTKGGKFFKKEDFKKMYCISEKEYEALEPYIEIKKPQYADNKTPKAAEIFKVEVNTASEEELKKIKGIGTYFASQIIKYRIRLGGYNAKEQLMEVPKMDSTKYNDIKAFIEVNVKAIHKININTATFEQLKQHPYIGHNIALSLINYRLKHGVFKSVSEIKNSALITEKNYPKISYYLCTD
jgi:competence protein ComEA